MHLSENELMNVQHALHVFASNTSNERGRSKPMTTAACWCHRSLGSLWRRAKRWTSPALVPGGGRRRSAGAPGPRTAAGRPERLPDRLVRVMSSGARKASGARAPAGAASPPLVTRAGRPIPGGALEFELDPAALPPNTLLLALTFDRHLHTVQLTERDIVMLEGLKGRASPPPPEGEA